MDVLSDLLLHLNLACDLQLQLAAGAPWGLSWQEEPQARFHLLVEGAAWLRVNGAAEPLELRAGDFVVLPHGAAHCLTDSPRSAAEAAAPLLAGRPQGSPAQVRLAGGGRETVLVTGQYRFDRHGVHPLLSELPPTIRVRADQGWRSVPLEQGRELLAAELAALRPGSRRIAQRLLEVLFVQALRCAIEDPPQGDGGWLRGLRDERIAAALACIHGAPARPWSTAALAEQAGMGRTAFAAHFTALVGEPPPVYLTRWRIQTALGALREPEPALGEVAANVGYPSTAAFTRIFKRLVGMPPAEYRRAARAGREPLVEVARRPGSAPPPPLAARRRRG